MRALSRVVLKISGHLLRYPAALRALLGEVEELHNRVASFILVPGGSIFVDAVREAQGAVGFSDDVAHWMALKAMEVYGVYLSSVSGLAVEVENLEGVLGALRDGKIPIVLPYKMLKERNELPHSWDVSSDAIAAYIGCLIGADVVAYAKVGIACEFCGEPLGASLCLDAIDNYTPRLIYGCNIRIAIFNALNKTLRSVLGPCLTSVPPQLRSASSNPSTP